MALPSLPGLWPLHDGASAQGKARGPPPATSARTLCAAQGRDSPPPPQSSRMKIHPSVGSYALRVRWPGGERQSCTLCPQRRVGCGAVGGKIWKFEPFSCRLLYSVTSKMSLLDRTLAGKMRSLSLLVPTAPQFHFTFAPSPSGASVRLLCLNQFSCGESHAGN